jgi:hypothetical protein
MKKLWGGTDGTIKIRFLRACIFPIATYACETWHLIKQLRRTLTPLNINATEEFLKYHGLTKEQTNPFDRNYIFLKVGYWYRLNNEKEVFWAHKTPWRFGKENHGRVYYQEEGRGNDQNGDGFRISQTNCKWVHFCGHLAYDRAVIRRVVKGTKFSQGHTTEWMIYMCVDKFIFKYISMKLIFYVLFDLKFEW